METQLPDLPALDPNLLGYSKEALVRMLTEARATEKLLERTAIDHGISVYLLLRALHRIRDGTEDCECRDHRNPDCCIHQPDFCCQYCIAAAAIEFIQPMERSQ